MAYLVKTPSESFNGKRAEVSFVKGAASFDNPELVPVFKEMGYEVTEVKEVAAKEEVAAEPVKEKPKRKKRGE
jgi:hypothetical protein